MILTILISVVLSVTITFSILYYLGKKKSEEMRNQAENLEMPEGLEEMIKQLEKSLGENIQFEEISEDDFLELEKNKSDKKIYH